MRRLRELTIDIYHDAYEVPWSNQNITGYGVGPKKMSEHFAYIGAFKDHVDLGFYYGVDLANPKRLLEGAGKKLRHVKIEEIDHVQDPVIRELIEVTIEERHQGF